jgi:hypothetical protein
MTGPGPREISLKRLTDALSTPRALERTDGVLAGEDVVPNAAGDARGLQATWAMRVKTALSNRP